MRGGHIVGVELLIAESDSHAIELSKSFFDARAEQNLDGFEIWDKARVVHRHPPE